MIYETEADRLVALQARKDTIERAITFVTTASPEEVGEALYRTTIHQYLKVAPSDLVARLREALADNAKPGQRFGAWKAAQQICRNAGLSF